MLSFVVMVLVQETQPMSCAKFRPLALILSLIAAITLATTPVRASHMELKEVAVSVLVNAKPNVVWEAIRGQRKAEPDHRKLLSYENNEAVLEENFGELPVIGAASCIYKECEVELNKRIDYMLVKSDTFKLFQGSWTLTPSEDGSKTMVSLTSVSDPGLRIPFWKELTKMATVKHVKKRLHAVTQDAERMAKGT